MSDQTPHTEMCSCSSTTVVRIHSSGSYCADAQHERLADALREMRTLATDADADVEAAASDVLDALRKEPAPVPMPAPVVRSDRIERAAQIICDASPNGTRWADHRHEQIRDFYRARARKLAEAGLLVDATPAAQPDGDPEPFMILDSAADLVLVDITPDGVLLGAPEGAVLSEDQADEVAEALRIRAAARRAAMQAGGGSRG